MTGRGDKVVSRQGLEEESRATRLEEVMGLDAESNVSRVERGQGGTSGGTG